MQAATECLVQRGVCVYTIMCVCVYMGLRGMQRIPRRCRDILARLAGLLYTLLLGA